MKISSSLLLAAFCLLACHTPSVAQWTHLNGPYGARINVFATDGTDLFAGDDANGVFRSQDNGRTWTKITSDARQYCAIALASIRTGTNSSTLFQGTLSYGLFYSTDKGAQWTKADSSLPAFTSVRAISSIPDDSGGVIIFAATGDGVYRSVNGGKSWKLAAVEHTGCIGLAQSGTKLFAVAYNGRVFLSTDHGTTWTEVNTNLTGGGLTSVISDGANLFATTSHSGLDFVVSGSIFRSTDDGATWTAVVQDMRYHGINTLAAVPTTSGNTELYAGTSQGILRSTDGGDSWSVVTTQLGYSSGVSAITSTPAGEGGRTLFAGTWNGLFASHDLGVHWVPQNTGLTPLPIRALASGTRGLFAGTDGDGLFFSADNGATWTATDPIATGVLNRYVQDLAVVPVSGGDTTIFAATGSNMLRSTDNGTTWASADSGTVPEYVMTLAVSPGKSEGCKLFAGNGDGVFLSTDAGRSWAAFNRPILSGINAFAFLPNDTGGTDLLIGTNGDVYLSSDGDTKWTAVNNGWRTGVKAFAVLPDHDGAMRLFAAAADLGIYCTRDKGATWTLLNDGLANAGVMALAVKDTNLIAGTRGGVFLSSDHGQHWHAVNDGLKDTCVFRLLLSGEYLFVGTEHGIWRRPLSEIITGIDERRSPEPQTYALKQNFPNPFNPSTTIAFSVPERSHVSLKIFDALGREVSVLLSEELTPGTYSRQWNASGCPSGVYFYRLQAGSFTDTKKLLLIR